MRVIPLNKLVNDELVEYLEATLCQARTGDLVSVFILKIAADGSWTPNWRGVEQDRLKMIGIIEGLKWELLKHADEDGGL